MRRRVLASHDEIREAMVECGPEVLSEADLMTLVLGSTSSQARERARLLLSIGDGLLGLVSIPPPRLKQLGLSPSQVAAVLAAIELGCRLSRAPLVPKPLHAPRKDLARYLALRYGGANQEVMGAFYLDKRRQLLLEREVFRGTLNRTWVEPRPFLVEALRQGCEHIFVFHTHPSGDPSPSAEDVTFTRRLVRAAGLVGVVLLDHIVVCLGGKWESLKKRRVW